MATLSLSRFLVGVALSCIAVGPVVCASVGWRRRLLPEWVGVEGGIVEAVVAITIVTVVAEILGTIGRFELVPLVVGLAGAGGIALAGLAWSSGSVDPSTRPRRVACAPSRMPPVSRGSVVVLVLGLVPLTGAWLARTVGAIDRGMVTVDSLWYHLPAATQFVQTGRTTSVHYFDNSNLTAFYPATSSLLHGVGILLFGTDLVSTVFNMGWLALALAAGWCIGRPYGVAAATTLGVAVVMATPSLVATQPGGAYNDAPCLALLLSAVAVGLRAPPTADTYVPDVVAGLALGLAIGMKYVIIAPALAVGIALAVSARKGQRPRRAACMFSAMVLAGGYWYVRNAVLIGNPLPSISIDAGPLSLPAVKSPDELGSMSDFLFDRAAWRIQFWPALPRALGPAWWAILGLALVGMVGAALFLKGARLRLLGVAGIASLVAFVATPMQLAFGRPAFFWLIVRYATPALVIGFVLLPIVLARWPRSVLAALFVTMGVTQLDPTSWPTHFDWAVYLDRVRGRDAQRALVVLLAALLLLLVLVVVWRALPRGVVRSGFAVAAPLVVLFVGLAVVHDHYIAGRYAHEKGFVWARDVHDARIAAVGWVLYLQYPMYGQDLSNVVQFAGTETADGGFRRLDTCGEWARFLERGRYDYVAVAASPDFRRWTILQPDARLVATESTPNVFVSVEVYRLDRGASRSETC